MKIINISGHRFFDTLNNKSTVVDIGAGIGVFSEGILKRYKCNVIGYEASSRIYWDAGLKTNINSSKSLKKIKDKYPSFSYYNKPVWSDNTTLIYSEGGLSCYGRTDFKNGKKYEVKSIGINEILDPLEKIDILKIDCEGSEIEILNAISDENLAKISQICVEFHLWIGHKFKQSITGDIVDSIVKRLVDQKFEFTLYDGHPDYHFYRI